MAGFAIQLCLLLEHRNLVVGKDRHGRYTKPGFLETNFLEELATRHTVECRGPNNEVCFIGSVVDWMVSWLVVGWLISRL